MTSAIRRLMSLLLIAAMLFSLCCAAFAETLTLPSALKTIEEEAFYGDESLDVVVIPYGTTYIGPRAFAYSGVKRIHIPETVTGISEDAFVGTGSLTIVSSVDSFAHTYALDNGIVWEDNNSYRISGTVTDYRTGEPLSGAAVSLGGSRTTVTGSGGEYSFTDLASGVYTLSLSLSGYETFESDLRIAGSDKVFDVPLAPEGYLGSIGGVVVDSGTTSRLSGVRVTMDGELAAITGADGRYDIARVAPGVHTLVFSKGSFTDESASVTVHEGAAAEYNISLWWEDWNLPEIDI